MVPTLVLLPGMDGTGDLFAPLVAAIGPNVPTIVVSYPDRPLDYAAHEEIVRAAVPVGVPFILLGESFSGPIAISIAASAPPGLRGCVLCCSFVRCPRLLLRWFRPLLGLLPMQRVPDALANYFLIGRFGGADLRQRRAQAVRRISSRTLLARLRAIASVDATDALRRMQMPALYLRATQDRLVPRSAGDVISKLASNARVVDIEGPHFLLQAKPDSAAEAIRDFARQLA